MHRFKLNWKVYFFLSFFSLVIIIGARAVYMLLGGQVSYGEDGEEIGKGLSVFMAVLVSLVLSTYFITVLNLLKQIICFKRTALTITENGIENTLILLNLFAFVFVVPVKLIPWEAVKYFDSDNGIPYIRINIKEIEAGFLAKAVLFVLGYDFCFGFVKPHVCVEDVLQYQHRFNLK